MADQFMPQRIDVKNVAIDTPSFKQKQRDCVEKLRLAHKDSIVNLKKKIAALSKSENDGGHWIASSSRKRLRLQASHHLSRPIDDG